MKIFMKGWLKWAWFVKSGQCARGFSFVMIEGFKGFCLREEANAL